MTLELVEGFDATATSAAMSRRYSDVLIDGGVSWVPGRFGGLAISSAGSSSNWTKILTAQATRTVGLSLRMTGTGTQTSLQLYTLRSGAVDQMSMYIIDSGVGDGSWKVQVRRGGAPGVILATSTEIYPADGEWRRIEFRSTLNLLPELGGKYELRVDGNTVLEDERIQTAVDSFTADRVKFILRHSSGGGRGCTIDDVCVCSSDGAGRQGFLGDLFVFTKIPISDGDESDWTPSAAGDHYEMVDDPLVSDDAATYLESDTPGQQDTWRLNPITGTAGKILGLSLEFQGALASAGSEDVRRIFIDENSVLNVGAAFAIGSTAYARFEEILEGDPITGDDWLQRRLDSIQLGVEALA